MIRGITIRLIERSVAAASGGTAVGTENAVSVRNVLIGEPESRTMPDLLDPLGIRTSYTLALPKGDTHNWIGGIVTLPAPWFGDFYVDGEATAGIEANIPLCWNRKVRITRWVFPGSGAEPETLTLIRETPTAHGIFEPAELSTVDVQASLRHVELRESFDGKDNHLRPVYLLVLDADQNYSGEKLCAFRGKRWRISAATAYALYTELRIEEVSIDAGQAAASP